MLDNTAICICEIHCLALDGVDLNTLHKLGSKEKKSQLSRDSNSGLLSGKLECYLCTMQPPCNIETWAHHLVFYSSQCDSNSNGPNPFTMCKFPFTHKGQVRKFSYLYDKDQIL